MKSKLRKLRLIFGFVVISASCQKDAELVAPSFSPIKSNAGFVFKNPKQLNHHHQNLVPTSIKLNLLQDAP